MSVEYIVSLYTSLLTILVTCVVAAWHASRRAEGRYRDVMLDVDRLNREIDRQRQMWAGVIPPGVLTRMIVRKTPVDHYEEVPPEDIPFHRTIDDHPDDDGPRLVYADWLADCQRFDEERVVREECVHSITPSADIDTRKALREGREKEFPHLARLFRPQRIIPDHTSVRLPIIHADFSFTARQLAVLRDAMEVLSPTDPKRTVAPRVVRI